MNKRLLTPFLGLLAVAAIVPPGASMAQKLLFNCDEGMSERVFASRSNPGTDSMTFIWERELPMGLTDYLVAGMCNRMDEIGFFAGDHRVTFKKIKLVGVDSGNKIDLSRQTIHLRDGFPTEIALWDITAETLAHFQEDNLVLVDGKVTVKKKVAEGHLLTCVLAAIEVDMTGVQSTDNAPRRQRLFEAAHHLLPRRPRE